jgi:hypothetical protein
VRTLQWISSIAAVLGIVLLLSGALSTLSFGGGTTTSASNNAPAAAGTDQFSATPRTTDTQPGLKTPAPTSNPPTSTPQSTTEQDGGGKSLGSTTSVSNTLVSTTGLGALLLILSACGFGIAWAIRRRW